MNQSALLIADFEPKNIENYQLIDYELLDLNKLFKQCKSEGKQPPFLLIHPESKSVFRKLTDGFRLIKAAGGIVKNGKGEYLFIFRLGKWDLPKGKVDEREKVAEAAVREVEEECGIKIHYRGMHLTNTFHLYQLKGELVMKKTKWYEMGINGSPKLTPQKEEDITKAVWLDSEDFDKVRKNTYPLIMDLLEWMDRKPYICNNQINI
ncbi:MAG TPA: NUDIX domain-containing protein [Sphingobacteriaceae bacterium]|nr:NUDIX domain-containing protein [Sphingobacteriaceae bacterium]